jgi:DNA-binding NarL/FixJ family response regulator
LSRQIMTEFPTAKIIILSAETHLSYINEALQAGVAGYLLKENAPAELLQAIAAVREGKLHLCSEANHAVLADYKRFLAARGAVTKPVLSTREREVLRMVADGRRMKEIADRLGVGVKTVETYRRRLIKKLGCNSTADLIRHALREGLVPP